MILYNLTIKIEPSIKQEWLDWMQSDFIPLALNNSVFIDHKLCRLIGLEESDGITYALQLFCQSAEQLNAFKNNMEAPLHLELVKRFPNQLVFFPTAMEIL